MKRLEELFVKMRSMGKMTTILIPIALLLAIGIVFLFLLRTKEREIILSGTVEVQEVEITPEISAKVVSIYHREGDIVEKGEPLLDLDRSDLETRLRQAEAARKGARAEVSLARARMENAERDHERYVRLFAANAISASAYDAARTAYEVARDSYQAALSRNEEACAQVDNLRVQLQKTHLCAPIAGVILERNVEVGELVYPGIVAMTIGDLRRPWVRVYIGERDIGRVRIGQRAKVITDAYPERPFSGVLRYIADEAEFTPKNVQTREERIKLVYEARVYLENEEGILKPGMPVDVTLRLEE